MWFSDKTQPIATPRASRRIVENDTSGMTMSRAHATDTVAQVHAVNPACAMHGAILHREYRRISPAQRYNFSTRLHARSLFCKNVLTTGKVLARLRQQQDHLKGKDVFAVQVLMQRVEVAFAALEQ
jgi:hypothetical protein